MPSRLPLFQCNFNKNTSFQSYVLPSLSQNPSNPSQSSSAIGQPSFADYFVAEIKKTQGLDTLTHFRQEYVQHLPKAGDKTYDKSLAFALAVEVLAHLKKLSKAVPYRHSTDMKNDLLRDIFSLTPTERGQTLSDMGLYIFYAECLEHFTKNSKMTKKENFDILPKDIFEASCAQLEENVGSSSNHLDKLSEYLAIINSRWLSTLLFKISSSFIVNTFFFSKGLSSNEVRENIKVEEENIKKELNTLSQKTRRKACRDLGAIQSYQDLFYLTKIVDEKELTNDLEDIFKKIKKIPRKKAVKNKKANSQEAKELSKQLIVYDKVKELIENIEGELQISLVEKIKVSVAEFSEDILPTDIKGHEDFPRLIPQSIIIQDSIQPFFHILNFYKELTEMLHQNSQDVVTFSASRGASDSPDNYLHKP